MSELLGKAGGLNKYSEDLQRSRDPAWRGNSGTQVILIVLCVATEGLFYLSNTTNTAQSGSVLHDAT